MKLPREETWPTYEEQERQLRYRFVFGGLRRTTEPVLHAKPASQPRVLTEALVLEFLDWMVANPPRRQPGPRLRDCIRLSDLILPEESNGG